MTFPDATRSAGRLTWHLDHRDLSDISVHAGWPSSTPDAWAWHDATGAGIRVCVVDSGVEQDHPLVGRVDASYAVEPDDTGDLRLVTDDSGDRSGHGTACAGIIRGLAPECELVSLRVLGGLHGSGPVLMAGLRWAVSQGFDVINLSLSTGKRQFLQALHELADEAYFSNTLLVASAHNRPVESFPWRFSSVISVGSHREPDPRLIYYNPWPPVEFFACGVNVPVAWLGGTQRRCSGNSFATPHVAGLAALAKSRYGSLTPFQIKTVLYLESANVRNQ